jgi:hypothetical protein
MLTADRLLLLAETMCKSHCTPFPRALRQYVLQWRREALDLDFAWSHLRPRLEKGLPFEPVDALVRQHDAAAQKAKDERDRAACPPLDQPSENDWVTVIPARRGVETTAPHTEQEPKKARVRPEPGLTRRKRTDTKTQDCVDFLHLHLNRGPVKPSTLEARAHENLILPPGVAINKYTPMQRAKTRLGIESKRHGFGADGGWVWQYRPPSWATEGLGNGDSKE